MAKEKKIEKTRLKIFLAKEDIKDETDFYKGDDFAWTTVGKDMLYYKASKINVPKWYKNYLGLNDKKVFSATQGAFLFRTLKCDGKNRIFAITFGGGEKWLNNVCFEEKFGLRIALNSVKEFLNIRKDNIANTLSKTREQAAKGQNLDSFGINIENDILNAVTIRPMDASLSYGNIVGASYVSISTDLAFDKLDEVLERCYKTSRDSAYKENYGFIDQIREVAKDDPITLKAQQLIVDVIKSKDCANVWFGVPDIIDWEDVCGFKYAFHKRKPKEDAQLYDEISTLDIYDLMESEDALNDLEFSKLAAIKVFPQYTTHDSNTCWTLIDCLYAQVVLDSKQYVWNNNKLYEIDCNYVESINRRFGAIKQVVSNDPKTSKEDKEADYSRGVCLNNPSRYVYMDCECLQNIEGKSKVEICDIYDKREKSFIHIKIGKHSSVLSHLFNQAYVSADIFASERFKKQVVDLINKHSNNAIDENTKINEYTVIMAIISKKEQNGEKLNLPFFSKLCIVNTCDSIKKLGYKNVELMHIEDKS